MENPGNKKRLRRPKSLESTTLTQQQAESLQGCIVINPKKVHQLQDLVDDPSEKGFKTLNYIED